MKPGYKSEAKAFERFSMRPLHRPYVIGTKTTETGVANFSEFDVGSSLPLVGSTWKMVMSFES
jgi:hypothetical protein